MSALPAAGLAAPVGAAGPPAAAVAEEDSAAVLAADRAVAAGGLVAEEADLAAVIAAAVDSAVAEPEGLEAADSVAVANLVGAAEREDSEAVDSAAAVSSAELADLAEAAQADSVERVTLRAAASEPVGPAELAASLAAGAGGRERSAQVVLARENSAIAARVEFGAGGAGGAQNRFNDPSSKDLNSFLGMPSDEGMPHQNPATGAEALTPRIATSRSIPVRKVRRPRIVISLSTRVLRAQQPVPLHRIATNRSIPGARRRGWCGSIESQSAAILGRPRCGRGRCCRESQSAAVLRRRARRPAMWRDRTRPRPDATTRPRRFGPASTATALTTKAGTPIIPVHGPRRAGARAMPGTPPPGIPSARGCGYAQPAARLLRLRQQRHLSRQQRLCERPSRLARPQSITTRPRSSPRRVRRPTPPPTADWLPLGVFALSKSDHPTNNLVIQLAVNKSGVIRGNYTDTATQPDAADPRLGR